MVKRLNIYIYGSSGACIQVTKIVTAIKHRAKEILEPTGRLINHSVQNAVLTTKITLLLLSAQNNLDNIFPKSLLLFF